MVYIDDLPNLKMVGVFFHSYDSLPEHRCMFQKKTVPPFFRTTEKHPKKTQHKKNNWLV
jgi:hypothetical protein